MNEERDQIAQMRAITISREYGSGGGEVALHLAQRLGWKLIDHQILVHVAQQLNISVDEATEYDEKGESPIAHILTSLQAIQPAFVATAPMVQAVDAVAYYEALCQTVTSAVDEGHVVIVGRGSQVLLANRRDVLHTRIVAPLEQRIAYVMQREELDAAAARTRIEVKEQDRIRYLRSQHHEQPDNAHLYDLILNAAVLSLDNIVDLIVLALRHKATRLTIPTDLLGPQAGLPRYPGRPGDLRPPRNMNEV